MSRSLAQALAESIAPLGLAPAQYLVLCELWKGDGLTQSVLATRLAVEQPTMARTLARMARDGLITRSPHPTDNRAVLVRITSRAASLRDPAKAAARQVHLRAFGSLSKKEQDRFIASLRRIIGALDQTDAGTAILD